MLDANLLRKNLDFVINKLKQRGFILNKKKFDDLETQRKFLQKETESLQEERNLKSEFISQAKKTGKNITILCKEVNRCNDRLSYLKNKFVTLKEKIMQFTSAIPNLPEDDVPVGTKYAQNKEISQWGQKREVSFEIKCHTELENIKKELDFISGAKLTGSKFVVMRGTIAMMHRALSQFMLDLHIHEHNYLEVSVPYLVNHTSLYGTGQLPKFYSELFHIYPLQCSLAKYTLIPTAEVPLTNLVRNEILEEKILPLKMVAYTPCFRSEAGSYGSKSKGLIRMHQFDKVELVQIVTPDHASVALEELIHHAEKVLQLLNLPYRKVLLCAGEMSFCSKKTYDLEVWLPSKKKYCEVSSCSNMGDFQTRRMNTRFKKNKSSYFLHTLNGSGLAIGRTLVAILENYQQKNGSIKIPKVLRPYMRGLKFIANNQSIEKIGSHCK